MASICGWMRCIFSDDFIIMKRVGSMATFRISVSTRIAQPQFGMPCTTKKRSTSSMGFAIQPHHPKLTTCSRFSPLAVWTVSSSPSSFGPTNRRVLQIAAIVPTAVPRMET